MPVWLENAYSRPLFGGFTIQFYGATITIKDQYTLPVSTDLDLDVKKRRP